MSKHAKPETPLERADRLINELSDEFKHEENAMRSMVADYMVRLNRQAQP